MIWFVVWVLLVAGAVALLGLLTRSVVRKGVALGRELGDVSADVAQVTEQARTAFEQQLAAAEDAPEHADPDREPLTSAPGLR